jgi:beta-N-acetylhexosaminidase
MSLHESVLGVGITGPRLTETEKRILTAEAPAAIILFARNVESADQLSALTDEIHATSPNRPLILIDEEGGRVDRLREILPGIPGAGMIGRAEDSDELAAELGHVIGMTLDWFGIDVNLAPVVDLEESQPAPGLERRCFGSDPEYVAFLAQRFVRAQAAAGVASCLKHFPGLGRASADSHYGTTEIAVTPEELARRELVPFRLLGNEAGGVLVSHASYPLVDPDDLPATLSRAIVTRVLRDEVGFTGLAMTDDMEMHAVSDLASLEQIAEMSLRAGNDLVLYCSQVEMLPKLGEHVRRRVAADESLAARVHDAQERIGRFHDHCESLRKGAKYRAASFGDLEAALAHLRERVEHRTPQGERRERREVERTRGTGKTGREEWT